MNFKEVRDLLKMMNVDMNEHHAHRLFTVRHTCVHTDTHTQTVTHRSCPQMADKSKSGTLEDDEFVLFYKMLTQREDVLRVFQELSSDGQKLSQGVLEDFLKKEQLEDEDVQQHAEQLIQRYEPSDAGTSPETQWEETRPHTCRLSLCSQASEGHDLRRLPAVLGLRGGRHLQPALSERLPGHEPPTVPLFHLVLAQHLPDGGPATRTQQRGGLHQVRPSIS